MLDSRLTRGDGDVDEGGVKKTCWLDLDPPPPHHHDHHTHTRIHTHTYTHTHNRYPSCQIIMLSAAPVRQTVRGSLGGVPQGSIIGLLRNPR